MSESRRISAKDVDQQALVRAVAAFLKKYDIFLHSFNQF